MSPPNERGRPCEAASETTRAAAVNDEHTANAYDQAVTVTSAAQRVQQRRAKGWRKPPGAVSVVRGTRWGNPYKVAEYGRHEAILRFEADLTDDDREVIRRDLAGRTLMCWCPPHEACHADALLRIANGGDAA